MQLLERGPQLEELASAALAGAEGRGEVLLVHGEAGIGKSSLVSALREHPPGGCRVLVGACDALTTPRTLGPLRDLTSFVGPRLASALRAGDREEVFDGLLDELGGSPGTVLVIEDVHWADEATLDALSFLARRIATLPVLLVLTYRDDEVDGSHPLARVLGDLHANVRHLAVPHLSLPAVAAIADERGLDPQQVFDLTQGNPYFVGELVASADSTQVPRTVVDAVTGRLHRLAGEARHQVEQLAVIPSAVPSVELGRLVPGGAVALGEAEERGLLVVRPEGVAFRHELTRRAIVDAMPTARRIDLNARVLAVLLDLDADPARIVSHALEAGRDGIVAAWAPRAARDAAVSGAHRQAAEHYRSALERAATIDPGERIDLMQAYAIELYTLGSDREAVAVQEDVLRSRREAGDSTALGASLRWSSRFHWLAGQRREAEIAAREASDRLSTSTDRALYALALSNEAQLAMLAHDLSRTLELAPRAVAIARETGDRRALSHALNNLGTAHLLLNRDEGIAELTEAAEVAAAGNLMDDAARAHVNLVWSLLDQYRLELAERHLGAALEFSSRAEVMGLWTYQQVERARLHLARAEWDDALAAASHGREALPHAHCVALTVIGLVQVRRGDPEGEETLVEAAAVATRLGELQRTGPVAAARGEAALLRGARDEAVAILAPAYDEAVRRDARNQLAEFAALLRRAGAEVAVPEVEHPFAVEASGDWRRAAAAWRAAGAPYHQAAALAGSPHDADRLEALAILDRIGAVPLARSVRAGLRASGVRAVPRGPSRPTRANPEGLTDRQVGVLELLATGMTNAEIAARLVVSVRTVDSHVAAILAKLGAASRQDAVREAQRRGVFSA
ncbi:ATP-binding protein [Agromyces salentinus]|uniref:AAA family ATPase n=1 Tax=Agromyces salentinus TaxID=269421 RepID=A0ABN2MW63_9MICO|nr:LuxR family transcriptional regulator [Agromyces salentinus]